MTAHRHFRKFEDTIPVERKTFTSCTGPCDQGRKLCPSPLACERDDGSLDPSRGILCALAIVAGIVSVVLLAHWWLA